MIESMIGKRIVRVTGKEGDDEMIFVADDGSYFRFYHDQGCCESVGIQDVIGDLTDLVGEPLIMAEEVSSEGTAAPSEYSESFTWTFYKFATIKGYVTVRWLGESNGYYSESVELEARPASIVLPVLAHSADHTYAFGKDATGAYVLVLPVAGSRWSPEPYEKKWSSAAEALDFFSFEGQPGVPEEMIATIVNCLDHANQSLERKYPQ